MHFANTKHLDYWERLEALNIFSIQRRFEKYRIIYIWKILEQIVPNYGIREYQSQRHGRLCRVPKLNNKAAHAVQSLREASLAVHGAQLFNAMPQHIREITNCRVETFKAHLDKHLRNIPDQPHITGYTQRTQAETNSILHMKNVKQNCV